MSKKKHIYLFLISLVVVFLGREIYKFNKAYELAWQAPAFQSIRPEGSQVTIIEFIDYNCPHCRAFQPKVKEVLNLRKDIHYIMRPIGPLGEHSEKLAKLTLAAGMQGKFLELHDIFLEHRGSLSPDFVDKKAQEIGLNLEQLYQDASSEEVQRLFNENTAASGALGVRYIPAFMINKTLYIPPNDSVTTKEFLQAISDAS